MANIGLAWVNPAPLTKPENVVNFAKKCEAMGCHSMWTIDRIVYDNLESLTILTAAAAARIVKDSTRHIGVARQHAPSGASRQDHRHSRFHFQWPHHAWSRFRQSRKRLQSGRDS